ncbi:MAG TPA: low temperature requirement protein A [Actinomycetes bacterium]|nr:low temperature requirement protein A [Actinomycetes bacterium]
MAVHPADPTRQRLGMQPVSEGATVTSIELFFDLVFVFALTQVTQGMADELSWRGVLRGVLLMGLLWWSWVAYAWLFNIVRADEGVVRIVLFASMGAMFILSLAIPEAFDDLPGGLYGPVVIALCYFVFRMLHLVWFWIVAKDDPGLRRQLLRWAPAVFLATALLLLASRFEGPVLTLFWALALLVDYGGTYLIGPGGWRLRSATHFSERHGLILIIALGESIVAIGVGVAALPISWPIIVASMLGLTVAAALWWAYFDVGAKLGEQALEQVSGVDQAAMGRDGYSYLHFPMITGIVLLALGLKKVLEYVGDTEHHDLADHLTGIGLYALYGGVVLFLLGHIGFKARMVREWNPVRIGAAIVIVALIPFAASIPALAALAVLTAVTVIMVAIETFRFADMREAIRHGESH